LNTDVYNRKRTFPYWYTLDSSGFAVHNLSNWYRTLLVSLSYYV